MFKQKHRRWYLYLLQMYHLPHICISSKMLLELQLHVLSFLHLWAQFIDHIECGV